MSTNRGPYIDDMGMVRLRCTACRAFLPLSEFGTKNGQPIAECGACLAAFKYGARHGIPAREVRAERQAIVKARPHPNVRLMEGHRS